MSWASCSKAAIVVPCRSCPFPLTRYCTVAIGCLLNVPACSMCLWGGFAQTILRAATLTCKLQIIIIIIIIVIIIIIIIIIVIIIAFKGAIRDFLQSPHSAANRLQHARSSGPGAIVRKSRATHRALITCNMSCYVPLGTKGQLSY